MLLVVAVAAVRSLDDPDPDPAARLSSKDVDRIAGRVERLRGLRFTKPIRPLFLDRAEAVELLERAGREEYPVREQLVDEETAKLLGLLKPEDSLSQVLERVDQEQVLGFYDDRSKRLAVIRDAGVSRPLLELTLAHELVHALEDQRFGLDVGEGVRDDEVIAEASLAEGTATAVMTDYAAEHLGLAEILSIADVAEEAGLPEWVERQLLFPYLAGEEFVSVLRGQSGDWEAVDSVFRFRRPRTSEQVIHPRRFAAGEGAARVAVPDLRRAGWRRLRRSSMGEFDVQMLLALNDAKRPAEAAAGWGGGRFELWRRAVAGECPAPCVKADLAWIRLRWDTTADRMEGEAALRGAFEHGLRAVGGRKTGALRMWSSRGGAIALGGRGRETTVVLAPEAGLAAQAVAAR
ncbi:MAG: hypothetical protein ACRDLQ_00025 [Solirubrobacterales bacterium]